MNKNYEDGFYYSPDWGEFEKRGDKVYFPDGSVKALDKPSLIRLSPGAIEKPRDEWYSLWSEEKRTEIVAEHDRRARLETERIARLHERAKQIIDAMSEDDQEALLELYGFLP